MVNPAEADYALSLFEPHAAQSWTLYQTRILVDRKKRLCLAGPALGAAAATLVLEKLIVLGVKKIWLLSCCGVLDPAFAIGDLLLARGGVSGEGVSRYYSSRITTTPGAEATSELLDFSTHCSLVLGDGLIWSTDAPYRERRSQLLGLQEAYGVNGVDMEFSALCTVAKFRGVSLGGLFIVSDMLWTRNWKPGFGGSDFKIKNQDLVKKIIDYRLREELKL